ncbi:MAG TPA: M13 family metallopeptidase [Kofleriaceae bacterium]|nr:M13 family metallopeptidase [Kofleriaceae bacterium]
MRTPLALILFAAACGGSQAPAKQAPPPPPPDNTVADNTPKAPPPPADDLPPVEKPTKPVKNASLKDIGLDPDALDRTADPCDDFYQFACGGWIKKTEIDADKPLAMRSFIDIEERNYDYLHDLLEKSKPTAETKPVMDKLTAVYGSCMDTAAIDKAGLKPIKPLLDTINKVKDPKSLSSAIIALQVAGSNAVFGFGPTEDFANAQNVIAGLDQAGLGLPDRDYYLKDENKPMRDAYAQLVEELLVEAGHKPDVAKTEAADVLALETEIAKVSMDKVMRRDPKAVYNKVDRDGVKKLMPHFTWDAFWTAFGLRMQKDVTVGSKEFFSGVDALMEKTKPETWRNYLTAFAIIDNAPFLSQKIEDKVFKLEQQFTGAAEQKPRWKRCVDRTTSAVRDLVGQMFVRDKFPGQSKEAAEQEVLAISAAMKTNIDSLAWMDDTTKQKAKGKLDAMAYHIGYPKKWRTYDFKIDAKNWGANALAARRAEAKYQVSKIGKPRDRDAWDIPASMVNAFYNPTHNKMVFPAGILQPPFYSVNSAVQVNLGGMGMVVGHELTHGFDDQGSQFDSAGNMANWWQPETEKQFKQRTQCVKDQYSGYSIAGVKLNGDLTAGENIADIGGVKLAFSAYRTLRSSAPETVVADGFTEDQQFFLSTGQVWCAKERPEFEKMLATVDEHSPPKWRINGTLADSPDFAKAFRCKAGTKMRPQKACVVW